jgi:hypothetical protein
MIVLDVVGALDIYGDIGISIVLQNRGLQNPLPSLSGTFDYGRPGMTLNGINLAHPTPYRLAVAELFASCVVFDVRVESGKNAPSFYAGIVSAFQCGRVTVICSGSEYSRGSLSVSTIEQASLQR